MKYSCNIIHDLMPLYMDGVCSEESKKIVEEHLEECKECQTYFSNTNEEIHVAEQDELQKISSFQAVKKRIQRKQIFAGFIAIGIVASIFVTAISVLKNTHRTVAFDDNISVSMVDGSLVGRLYGSDYTHIQMKNVEVGEDTYTFYSISNTAWNDISVNDNMMTEYVIVPKDKSANRIDRVYYYTGDFTGLENMNEAKLQTVIQKSELLWKK